MRKEISRKYNKNLKNYKKDLRQCFAGHAGTKDVKNNSEFKS